MNGNICVESDVFHLMGYNSLDQSPRRFFSSLFHKSNPYLTTNYQTTNHNQQPIANKSELLIFNTLTSTQKPPANPTMSSNLSSQTINRDPVKLKGAKSDVKCCKCGHRLNEVSALYSVVCTKCYHTKCSKCMAGWIRRLVGEGKRGMILWINRWIAYPRGFLKQLLFPFFHFFGSLQNSCSRFWDKKKKEKNKNMTGGSFLGGALLQRT